MFALVDRIRTAGSQWQPSRQGRQSRRWNRQALHSVEVAKLTEPLEDRLLLTSWAQVGLDIDGAAAGDHSGKSVSVSADGNTVAIGSPDSDRPDQEYREPSTGRVDVYRNIDGVWTQLGEYIAGEASNDNSGGSVSLSADGNTVAIGADWNRGNGNSSGHVRIYRFDDGSWAQVGVDIDGEAASDRSGGAVSLSADGSVVAIGARSNAENGTNSGHVRVFGLSDGAWTQIGQDMDGEAAFDQSAWSVSLSADGGTVAIGAIGNDAAGSGAGHVRLYGLTEGSWTQLGANIEGEAAFDASGWSVSLNFDGSTVAIGATSNNGNGPSAGHVRIFNLTGGEWTQVGEDIDGEAAGDRSGYSVSLSSDGKTVAIGAIGNDDTGDTAGHTRVYKLENGSWTQIGTDIDGEAASDASSWSVSLNSDGSTVAIGALNNDASGSAAGHVRVYQLVETVNLSIDTATGTEADATTITATVTSDAAVSGDQTVHIGFSGAGITVDDYMQSSTTITIPDGMNSGSVTFTVQDDRRLESMETGTLMISNPSSGLIIGTDTQNITITDNEVGTDSISLSAADDNAILVDNGDGTFTLRDVSGTFGGDVTFNPDPTGVIVSGLDGNDVIDFSTATFSTTISGGDGNDLLFGSSQADHLNGQSGRDTLLGGNGNDALYGGSGSDTLNGGAGHDTLRGHSGNDVLLGGAGRDMLNGGTGDDMLRGQGGHRDQLTGSTGDDTLDGGSGVDLVTERGDVDFILKDGTLYGLGADVLVAVEEVRLIGGVSANHIDASQFSGETTLIGGNGKDTLLGGSGRDVLRGGASRDYLIGGDGDDTLLGQGGSGDTLAGGVGIDFLHGGAGADWIIDDQVDRIVFDALDTQIGIPPHGGYPEGA